MPNLIVVIISLTVTVGSMLICRGDNCCFHADPHIKVSGTKEAVTEAKEKILNILNTNVRAKL